MQGRKPQATGEARPYLWATVLADLQRRLADGEFTERFPTDKELTAHYGVSRHTAREAVRRLDAVDRRPRLGGRVRRPASALENLGATLGALGTRLELHEAGRARRRSRPVSSAIGTDPGASLEVVVRVLTADGEPLLVSELWLPPGSPLRPADAGALLGLPPTDADVQVVDESVLPIVAPSDACAVLHLPGGSAVFCVEQLLSLAGRVAGWHRALIRPERYRCVVRWDPNPAT
ncbi:MAG: GntR family transcriptional regulator [Acidimicrobiia bacterium]